MCWYLYDDIDLVFLRLKFSVQNFYRRQTNRKPLLGFHQMRLHSATENVLSMRQRVPVAKHKFIERFSFSFARTQANNFIPRIGKTIKNFSHFLRFTRKGKWFPCMCFNSGYDSGVASKRDFFCAVFEWKRLTKIGLQTTWRHFDQHYIAVQHLNTLIEAKDEKMWIVYDLPTTFFFHLSRF